MECGEPVEQVVLRPGMTVGELVAAMGRAGAYNGGALAKATDIYEAMLRDRQVTRFLGLAGAMVPAGMGRIVSDLIDGGFVDVLVSTGANLTHDIIEALGCRHYHGTVSCSDVDLREAEINRIYDVFLPNESFIRFEEFMQERFDALSSRGPLPVREFLSELGLALPSGILASAARRSVPVFCPAVADSMIGLQHWLFTQAHRPALDALSDMNDLLSLCFDARSAGVLIVGGGVPKNYILQGMLMTPRGFDYAVQLTGDRPDLGGLSGATLDEARSWGKITATARAVTVYGDATITLPLLVAAVRERIGV
ncbi:MAG: deoxyhypusine synthase [Methanolinea sp.]|nr:deoxyhypusine synthase [Methanolinea sp.]